VNNSKIGQHISEQFNKDLEDIRNKVLIMGGLVEQQIDLAVKAYKTGNVELAEQVIKQDNDIDAMEVAIDLECNQILALRQPMALDLRLLIAVIKIIHELERMGDKAERIAEMAIQLAGSKSKFPHHEIDHMAKLVSGMLHDALDAFARMTLENVSEITARDDDVDREYENILRQLITRMMEDPKNITLTLDVLWTVRALERIGDLACYICEHLVNMIKGEDVRHLSKEVLAKKIDLTTR
jgi:phosphate transport system protein